ncbi:MAG: acetylornithine/succinylornithine family transaminase [Firmicutes bacterium]|nr:acetylornithine/succinylornithine family transaminase [Bacillota bacterium]
MSIMQMDQAAVAATYKRFPVEIVSGKGSVVVDPQGKEYIDMGSGIGVTAFGIADEAWQQAVIEQIGKVQHMSNLYYTEPCARLATMLCEKTGMKKVFFSNSGAEANECAIKVARKYALQQHGADHYTIVTLQQSFHGRTLATLAATGQDVFHSQFLPLPEGFVSVPANDIEAIKAAAIEHKAAALMLECVQGEGGVRALDADYLQAVAAFAKEQDILLIVDEVQAGNGRTGKLYSYMHFGIQPDIISTAKGLSGGLPLGATLMSAKVENVLTYGDHGSTFGGNPVCCAAAISVFGRLTDELLAEVMAKGEYIREQLIGAPGVEAVTGLGLMIGIKTTKPAAEVLKTCMDNGVLCLTAKDKLRLLPALNIPQEVLAKAISVIKAACAE